MTGQLHHNKNLILNDPAKGDTALHAFRTMFRLATFNRRHTWLAESLATGFQGCIAHAAGRCPFPSKVVTAVHRGCIGHAALLLASQDGAP